MPRVNWSLKPQEWAPVPIEGFEHYKVSNYGDVVNTRTGKTLTRSGARRPMVLLTNKGKSKNVYVSRLVALAFIPNPDNLPQVNHINGKAWDNYVENLEWCTKNDNFLHCRYFELLEIGRYDDWGTIQVRMPYYIIKELYEIMKNEHLCFSEFMGKVVEEYKTNHINKN